MDFDRQNRSSGARATLGAARLHRRQLLQSALAGSAALAVGLHAPAVIGQAKPFDGVTLNGASFPAPSSLSQGLHPGVRGSDRDDGQLRHPGLSRSTTSAPTWSCRPRAAPGIVVNVTFIYTGRWIGAGWLTHARRLRQRPQPDPARLGCGATSSAAPRAALQDAEGKTYGFAWEAGAMIMGIGRGDLLEQAGLGLPTTFDELITVCEAIHGQEGVTAVRRRQAAPLELDSRI